MFAPRLSTKLTGSPPGGAPPVGSHRLLLLSEPRCTETTVFFVNALLLATRWMMRSGAMTYQTHHPLANLSERWGRGKAHT